MPECYKAAAPDVWSGSFISACSGTCLPLSFTEEIETLEGVSLAENVKGLSNVCMLFAVHKAVCIGLSFSSDG